MTTVPDGLLPVYSPQKQHPAFSPASLRRRRLLIPFLTFLAFFSLLFWGHHLLFQQLPPPIPVVLGDDPRPTFALTPLGLEAEQTYHLGSLSLPKYRDSLRDFISTAFPSQLQSQLTNHLDRFLDPASTDPLPERPKIIWQTNDVNPQNRQTRSWSNLNQDHEYHFLYDNDAEKWVRKNFKGSAIEWTWDFLPNPVMKADLLRYLLLLVEGGIYSDIDTLCLKSVSKWGADADLWRQTTEDSPSGIIGIEADVGNRADWHTWWSRPLQIVQWTMSFRPGHPMLLDTIRRIYASCVEAHRVRSSAELKTERIVDDDKTVLEWTGPAVFTDAALRFLRIESNLTWADLRGLEKPLRAESITILPVTGFSPGVGNFGAKETWHKEAMVHHEFQGSWKPPKPGQNA